MRTPLGVLRLLLLALSCTSQPAAHSPESSPNSLYVVPPTADASDARRTFKTYDEAKEYVRQTYEGESIDTSRSSWITGAEYFEASGHGYLILGMRGNEYIFESVPLEVWEGFKVAPSMGRYYNDVIRGRYGFDLASERLVGGGP